MNPSLSLSTWALSGMALLAAATQVWAEPAQAPLTARSATPPQPNLMLTIDDSGSMLFDFIPEETFTVNGKSVIIGSSPADVNQRFWPVGYPNDKRRSPYRKWTDNNWYYFNYIVGGVVTALGPTNGSVFEMQFRSPDINALYYNPDIWYRPWKNVDSLPNDMANSTFTNARLDPVFDSTSVLDLSKTISSKQAWCTGFRTCDNPTKTRSFNPAIYYRLKNSTVDPNQKASYTFYNLNTTNDSAEPYGPATKHPSRKDCPGTRCTQAQERQNFANWFTYYRLRETMTKAAISRSLVDYQDKIRVGWAQFNASDNSNITTRVQQGIQAMTAAQLKLVLGGIHNISSFSGTPTRTVLNEIGQYFEQTGDQSPWLGTPGNVNSGRLSCRRSANFLLTDGYYNDSYSGVGDADGTNGPKYDGAANPDNYPDVQYLAVRPYMDGSTAYSDTLADVAIKYFKTDLQPGIDNKVPPVQGDIAFWQHLTQYTVGLGVIGTLDSSPANKNATLAQLKAGTKNWPNPDAGSAQKVDDLWHAAVNTGGDFYSAKSYEDLSKAMKDAIGKAVSRTAKEAGVSLNSSSKVQGTYKFVPKYQAVSWFGDLEAFTLNELGAVVGDAAWKASQPTTGLIDWSARNLLVWNPDANKATPFTWPLAVTDGMGKSNAEALVGTDGTVNGATLTDWVRGDTSNEAADKAYRTRSGNRFPDFVNSPPVYVRDLVNLEYGAISADYASYVAAKSARAKGVVFLGGNGGMLHAFDSATGAEVMGFLPSPGLPKLAKIAAKDYGTNSNFHQYVVDGPHIESDAYIATRRDASAKWSNVVVGTMGAGGRAIYALHVPTSSPTSLDADTVLWQRSSADDPDFGYMMGDVAVGKIQQEGGSASVGWKVFVGNGIDSGNGKAVLMVIDLSTGAVDKVVLDPGSGNGAMGVSLVRNSHGEVVAAYVGDIQGKLWRVEFGSATNSSTWRVGYGGQPLLQAKDANNNPQAITNAPYSLPFLYGTGRLVVFGTGRLLSDADADSTSPQTLYAVLDPNAAEASTGSEPSPYYGSSDLRSSLARRTTGDPISVTVGGVTRVYYPIVGEDLDWKVQKGWYLELANAGQRMIYPVQPIFGDYVFMQTMVPAPRAAECERTSGSGVNFIFRAHEGKPPIDPIVDTNGDGKVDENDDPSAGGYEVASDGTDGLIVPPDSECINGFKIVWDFDTDPRGKAIRLPCGTDKKTIVDRVWREIVNPPQPGH
ncbi:MAG: hypothetical protein J0M20_03840 [Burkholderiales bacterium]|nr:hypothetical protein [Burkholderiales bacterium]